MRTLSLLLAFALVTFSGCTESPTNSGPPESPQAGGNETGTPTTGPTESQGNGTGNTSNTPPIATLTADVTNGTAPLAVQFTVNGTDADGDNLTWVLAVNGTEIANGTEVPSTVNHTFEAGTFNITVAVKDGEHEVHASLAITVVAATGPAGPAQTEQGDFIGIASGCDNTVGVLGFPGLLGAENERFVLEPTTAGGTFTISFDSEGPALRYYLVYFGEGGSGVGGARPSEEATYSGEIPAEATYFRIGVCGGGQTTFTYEGYAA